MSDPAISLHVRLHDQVIGTLIRLPNDQNLFVFDTAYVDNAERATLSLSFKDSYGGLITRTRPTQTRLPPFFSNLLPEGPLRDYLAERANIKAEREFYLALALGRDLPGALEIAPIEATVFQTSAETKVSNQIEDRIPSDSLRFSLAGVQLKFSAVKKATGGLTIPTNGVGGSWIVKLPSQKFSGVPENEFAMMELARNVGIDVPETKLVALKDIHGLPKGIEVVGDEAFAIKRFDREAGRKVHIEDFAQIFGVYPSRKYKKASYRNIAEVVWVETGEPGTVELIRRLVFNALIGNADMHLKNWSLIYPDTRHAQLAPAYDFVSTIAFLPDTEMALTLVDAKSFAAVTREQFSRFALKSGLPEKLISDTVTTTLEAFARAWKNLEIKALDDKTREKIESHLSTVPLWTSRKAKKPSAS